MIYTIPMTLPAIWKRSILGFSFVFFFFLSASSQVLQRGFDPDEFAEILAVNSRFSESPQMAQYIPPPARSRLLYKSGEFGLVNHWQLWLMDERVAVICTRGSTREGESWLANLFAAQIPAKGVLHIEKDFEFDYSLAEHPRAAVHAGYVFSSAFLLRDVLPKMDSCYQAGVRDFILSGHSQGGGITYIMSAYLLQMQKAGKLPADMRIKVYTSASPKPGNLYFAYDYEHSVGEGWSQHVVNTEDWVPQSPFTVQTIADLPDVNPVPALRVTLKKQNFFKRLFFNSLYKKMTNPSQKAVDRYQKYLGKFTGKQIKKYYPDFVIPDFVNSNEYVRTGKQVVLYPDSGYFEKFDYSKDKTKIMLHHSTVAYYYLLKQTYEK
ncbi:lipase family protein [Sphingobacterium faecale]|uniref:Lipase family protein n=1 Tax=Sphingobacterium faecale TaxID=2803775 RepID=A0ABS1R918_9SPHI|nr:lipase family protein [Sphingobacterium faecale]MBL1411168.1 lipase family protein [Sphingobacterium faecale]